MAEAAPTVEQLTKLLEQERARNRALEQRFGVQQMRLEAEEESLTNKLIFKISEIERDRENLRQKLELEERRIKEESDHLEKQRKQMASLTAEKEELSKKVKSEEDHVNITLKKKLQEVLSEKRGMEETMQQVIAEKQELQKKLEREHAEHEQMMNMKVGTIEKEKMELEKKLKAQEEEVKRLTHDYEEQRSELKKLKDGNFALELKIQRQTKQSKAMQNQKAQLSQSLEIEWERQLNTMLRLRESAPTSAPGIRTFDRTKSGPLLRASSQPARVGEASADGVDGIGELLDTSAFAKRRTSQRWESQSVPSMSPKISPFSPSPLFPPPQFHIDKDHER